MAGKGKKKEKLDVLEQWVERDLSEAAGRGELPRAYAVEPYLARISEVLSAGKCPLIVGESGVGKTALVHELLARASRGEGPPSLRGKRVLQISIRRCAATLTKDDAIGDHLHRLVKRMTAMGSEVVPFFRDFHLGLAFDLESAFEAMTYRLEGPLICEGEASAVREMLEWEPGLEREFVLIEVAEPDLAASRRILTAWAEGLEGARQRFSTDALECGLQLAHRFLGRNRMPRKVLEPMGQLAALAGPEGVVTEAEVVEGFCSNYGLPRDLVDPEAEFDLEALARTMHERVFGQDEAVSAMVAMISRIKAGLIDPRRPFGVFLFVGPTGVGKTHLARAMADQVLGSAERLLRFNMADFPEEQHATTLFGDPDAHEPDRRKGLLTQRIMGQPLAVMLLDEFEKAHEKVHDRFLQLFDEGRFINGAGQTISCLSQTIVATSNAGAELWRRGSMGFIETDEGSEFGRELHRRLENHFRFEFLNRFDQVVHFRPLARASIRAIAQRELEMLSGRAGLRQRKVQLEYDEDVLDWLTTHGYDPYFGARFLRRTIEREVSTPVSELLVRERPAPGVRVGLSVRGKTLRARILTEPESPGRPPRIGVVDSAGEESTLELDRDGLAAEARRLLVQAAARREALGKKRDEYERLLEELNDDRDLWGDRDEARRRLGRFRELDVAVRIESRLAAVFERLEEKLAADATDVESLARSVASSTRALREWEERFAAESEGAVWLVISDQDPAGGGASWVETLTRLELAWCRRLELEVEVAGWAERDRKLARVVLEVAGPGAAFYLAMEEGIHRRHQSQTRDARARIEVVRHGAVAAAERPSTAPLRGGRTRFERDARFRSRLLCDARGQDQVFVGPDAASLAQLVADLAHHLAHRPEETPPTARIYGEDGAGARDPRTGVVIARPRDVQQGGLEPLLRAWREAEGSRV